MKPIQITIDESLLRELDAQEEVRRLGRSAVLRAIAAEYILRQKRAAVTRQYQKAYAGTQAGLGAEFTGWEDEGVWPDE